MQQLIKRKQKTKHFNNLKTNNENTGTIKRTNCKRDGRTGI